MESLGINKYLELSKSRTFKSLAWTVSILGRFLVDKIIFLSIAGKASKQEPSLKFSIFNFQLSINPAKNLVFGVSSFNSSKIISKLLLAFCDKIMNMAFLCIFLLTFCLKTFSLFGPKTIPPCLHMGDIVEPCLARPVPFWRQGFFPPPETSPIPLVWAEDCRRLAA